MVYTLYSAMPMLMLLQETPTEDRVVQLCGTTARLLNRHKSAVDRASLDVRRLRVQRASSVNVAIPCDASAETADFKLSLSRFGRRLPSMG